MVLILVPVLARVVDFGRGLRVPNIKPPTLDVILITMMKGNKTRNRTGRNTYIATIIPKVKKIRHNVKRMKNEPNVDSKRRKCNKRVRRRSVCRSKE